MINEKIVQFAANKGLTIDEESKGFSVKRSETQIRFFFKGENMIKFLQEYDEATFLAEAEKAKVIPKPSGYQPLPDKRRPIQNPLPLPQKKERIEVVVKDIQIPFTSMVTILIKLALASIPAAIILSLIASFFYALVLAPILN